MFMIYQINDAEKNREYRCRSYAYQIEHGFMITTDNYEISYCAKVCSRRKFVKTWKA